MTKITVIGGSQSGKTSLINRLIYNTFPSSEEETNDDEYYAYNQMAVWDCTGKEGFECLIKNCCEDTDILLFCIDLSQPYDDQCFERLNKIIQEKCPNAEKILVGTKTDSPDSNIHHVIGLMDELGASQMYCTSAKENEAIEDLKKHIQEVADKINRAQECDNEIQNNQSHVQFITCALSDAITKLKQQADKLPQENSAAIYRECQTLQKKLCSENTANEKMRAITNFEQNCREHLPKSSFKKTLGKAIADVVITATVTLFAVMVGFSIGFLAGAWSGPGALIAGVVAGTKAAMAVAGSTATAGLGAGAWSTYGLFGPSKSSKAIDDVVKEATHSQNVC